MMVGVRLGLLGATTHWGEPAGAVFVEPRVVFLELSALSTGGLPLRRHLHAELLLGDTIRILPSKQVGSRIWQVSSQGHGARNSANTGTDARKHAPKFTLDAWLARRSGHLRLRALDSLREG
jgi:hypothetical protein